MRRCRFRLVFYTTGPMARIDTILAFPSDRLDYDWRGTDLRTSIGVLSVVYRETEPSPHASVILRVALMKRGVNRFRIDRWEPAEPF